MALLSNEKIVMEKFLADNRVYNGTLPGGTTVNACNRYLPSPQISTRYFDVTGCVATATTYTLTVSGKDDATERSMAGFSYTINEMGGKATIIETNHAGWPTMNKPCWVLKKDGTC
ncbi:MAG: type IV pilin protein [Proteobacteria bacterium]|nr:type IV pilin protein [Pseudomonadota bacterium]